MRKTKGPMESSRFGKLALSQSRLRSLRSLDELEHGVDRLARRDDEAATSFDNGD